MDSKSVFNVTVCLIGIIFMIIHSVDLLLKKNRRKDENNLLTFILFTAIHFSTYLTFTLIKTRYTSNAFIMSFYTIFYIMNNVEAILLFLYTVSYVPVSKNLRKYTSIIVIGLFALYVIFDIINIFTRMYFDAVDGVYVRRPTMFFSQGYQFVAFAIVFIVTVFSSKLKLTEKIAFSVYCLLPLVAIIIQNNLPGYAIAYLSIIVAIEILFLFVNVKKNIELADEAKRTKEAEVKLMMSQIQPHFIYNTLSSISTLIKIDPDKAQKGLDHFTEYLRANLTTISKTGFISFSDELKHIDTYLALEKMRFDERLNVIYEIKVHDFPLPPLCIQPLVENAVKHGILKKLEGGTVKIKTYENDKAYIVEVSDDGVGFDVNSVDQNDDHIGLNNVRYRLKTMCDGKLTISSVIDKGTTAIVEFKK